MQTKLPDSSHSPAQPQIAEQIQRTARRLGFDLVGFAPVAAVGVAAAYREWIARGFHAEMAYLARPDAMAKREDPRRVLPDACTVVTVGFNYHSQPLPAEIRDDPSRGIVSCYAWGEDYHNIITPRLRMLAASLEARLGQPVAHRAYVDTGPLLERALAVMGGLGFVGKNTNLIHSRMGSWMFLGELLLGTQIAPRPLPGERQKLVERGTCGACTRCIDACPTGALVAPYVLDARRCISYLTIELKGTIPREMRPLMGNRIFGCDICQEICPWNRRFARPRQDAIFQYGPDDAGPLLLELMTLEEESFQQRFQDSPIKRAKRRGLLRNVAVALGNWGHPEAIPATTRALYDAHAVVREHAAWALGRIGTGPARNALSLALKTEQNPQVSEEIRLSLA